MTTLWDRIQIVRCISKPVVLIDGLEVRRTKPATSFLYFPPSSVRVRSLSVGLTTSPRTVFLMKRLFSKHATRSVLCSWRRHGWSTWATVLALTSVSVPVAAWNFLPSFMSGESTPNFVTAEVTIGPFLNRVLEQGEVESSSSVEVRCEVRSRNSSGTNILEIVPEGTRVQAGDFLIQLDASALNQELIQQQIVVSGSESMLIEAQTAFAAANLALEEYEEGTLKEQRETLEGALVVANENKRRAEEYLEYSRKLAERGYVSQVQLDADRFALDKAAKEQDVAGTKLRVLEKYTRKKLLNQLQSDIKTAKAKLAAREKTYELDKLKLEEIEQQIGKCRIVAPSAGQVVYANDPRRSNNGELLIAEGLPVRERQILVRLPDPTRMRTLAKVHESRISLVRKGIAAEIVTDALAERTLTGIVNTVSEYPLPSTSVYTSHIKEYAVEIEIHAPPPELRPGMSAQVNLIVEHLDSAIQIPIGAAIARGDQYFCAIPKDDGAFETREIKVGSSNDSVIVVTEHLQVGEKVVLNPSDDLLKKLELPEVAPVNVPSAEVLAAEKAAEAAAAQRESDKQNSKKRTKR